MADLSSGGWHLDKRVPIALIVTIAVQSGAAIWWAASINAITTQAATDRAKLEARVTRIETERDDLKDRITRVEVRLDNQNNLLRQILDEVRQP